MTSDSTASHPLVSIIVPVYNSAVHLRPCVRSILDQTYENLEVILIDDGSTDDSGAICDAFAVEDARVRVVHQANGGIASAQNAGLDRATGDLVTFCDNDDLMVPRMLERLVTLMQETGADMGCCRWRNVGASQGPAEVAKHRDDPFGSSLVFDDAAKAYQLVFSVAVRRLLRLELKYFSEANWGKVYRSHLFEGVRFPDGRYAQDVAVAMSLYERTSTVVSCTDALYYWLQRGDSVSHAVKSTGYYSDIVQAHLTSFDAALRMGITPARAYSGLKTLRFERRSAITSADQAIYAADVRAVRTRLRRLSLGQRVLCQLLYLQRAIEVQVYNRTVHRRR